MMLWYIGAFIVAIGLLVTIHELGHYSVARLCGVRVLRFSIGFGRIVLRYQARPQDTEWALGLIPLGGYVKMLDEREGEVAPAELPYAFSRTSVWQRIAIVAAGPLANLLLAVLIYWALLLHGSPEPRALLAQPPAASAAALAGLRAGDEITEVAARPARSWMDVRWELVKQAVGASELELTVRSTDGATRALRIPLAGVNFDDEASDPVQALGLELERPRLPPRIGEVVAGGAAAQAGLARGDLVLAVEGRAVAEWSALVAEISAAPGRPLRIEYQRGGERLSVSLTPRAEEVQGRSVGRIGVAALDDPLLRERYMVEVKHPPFEAAALALRKTWETAGFSLRMMGRMLTGEVSLRNISGPVTIADYAGQSARMGFEPYLRFLALISISIGVLNLLPVPLLDGGHIMYYLAEILMRRPVSQRTMEFGQQVGFAVLALLMAFAFINDISRLLS